MSQLPSPRILTEEYIFVAVTLSAWSKVMGERSIRKANEKSRSLLQDKLMEVEEEGGVVVGEVDNLGFGQVSAAVDAICPKIGAQYNNHVLLCWSVEQQWYTVCGLLCGDTLYTSVSPVCTKAHIWEACSRNVRLGSLEQVQKEAVGAAWRAARHAHGKGTFPTLKVWQQWCAKPTRPDCCEVRVEWRKAKGYTSDDCRTNRSQYERNMVKGHKRVA